MTGSADEIFTKCGGLGRFQVRILILAGLLLLPGVFITYMPLFVLTIPKHRCALANYNNDSYAIQSEAHLQLIHASIPWDDDDNQLSSCKMYLNEEPNINGSRQIITCSKYVYDQEFFQNSFIEQFDLVCDHLHWRSAANMMMIIGKCLAALSQGFVSDYFGRRNGLLGLILLMHIVAVVSAFPMNVTGLLATRLLAGLSSTSLYLGSFVFALEFLCLKHRRLFNTVFSLMWVIGGFILTGIAYFIRQSQVLILVVGVPTVLFLSYYWLIPESPRWLISKGRKTEAQAIFHRIARINRKEISIELLDHLIKEYAKEKSEELHPLKDKAEVHNGGHIEVVEKAKKENFLSIFRNRKMTFIYFIVTINWVANTMMYFALMFNVSNIPGSIYTNSFLLNSVDIVANIIVYFILDRWGRKLSYVGFMVIATFGCLFSIIPVFVGGSESQNAINGLALAGRGSISTSYNIVVLYVAELFPTVFRNSAIGSVSTISKIAAFSTPYVADLGLLIGGPFKAILPMLVCGGIALVGLILALFLPETMGKDLPNSFDEALVLYRNKKTAKIYKKCAQSESQEEEA